ncbi:MAG: hypothetical protein AB1720_06440 [Pseudomonadota bacterium]
MSMTPGLRATLAGGMALLAALGAQPLRAGETRCAEPLGRVSVDSLRVPAGATCTLDATRVTGDLVVERDATLVAQGVSVGGNVQAENARAVSVTSASRVGGNIQVRQGGAVTVSGVRVGGDIQIASGTRALSVGDNRVNGNVQVFRNAGGASIAGNAIDGKLQCRENRPAPTGGGNRVRGDKEDQCSAL